MIVNNNNFSIGGTMVPGSHKTLLLKPAILLHIIVIKTTEMFQPSQVSFPRIHNGCLKSHCSVSTTVPREDATVCWHWQHGNVF